MVKQNRLTIFSPVPNKQSKHHANRLDYFSKLFITSIIIFILQTNPFPSKNLEGGVRGWCVSG